MGPRVFISSTYYDLKYIREDLDQFVRNYKFETILFENGDIGYEPGRPLDESCYQYISKSDMVILVVGGLYGTPATGEVEDKFEEYMSITRKEFNAAKDAEIPIFVFIDSEVDAEYSVYQRNCQDIENQNKTIIFNATKNINVFRFIKVIHRYSNIVINTFRKSSDIKDYLARQWAGYFLNYLELRRENKKNKEIEDSLDLLKRKIDKINIVVDEMGKKLIDERSDGDYNSIRDKQIVSDIKNIIVNSFVIIPLFKTREERYNFINAFVKKIIAMLEDKTFYLYLSQDFEDQEKFYSLLTFDNAVIENIKSGVELELKEYMDELKTDSIQEKVIKEIAEDKKFLVMKSNS